jgi:hypothetical protein
MIFPYKYITTIYYKRTFFITNSKVFLGCTLDLPLNPLRPLQLIESYGFPL